MNKKFIMLMVFVLLLTGMMSLAGCGNTDEKVMKEYNVTLYFANDEYVQTGDESLDKMIVLKDYKMESEEGNQYMVLVDSALRNAAKEVEGADTLIVDKIVFNKVSVDGGMATVDLAGATLNGGSLEETYVISQIVDSLIASFEEIDSVQFLVDGEQAESLMGHFDATDPFTEGVIN